MRLILNHGAFIFSPQRFVPTSQTKWNDQAVMHICLPTMMQSLGFDQKLYILFYFIYIFDKGFWQFQRTANGVVCGLSKIT